MEKGIVEIDSQSIYSTGMGLQNRLIDEHKLVQMMGKEPNKHTYKELISRLRDNPQLLLEIIPTSKHFGTNKLRERLKKSHDTLKKNLMRKKKEFGGNISHSNKMRPGTSGTYMQLWNYSRENQDLIPNTNKPSSSVTHYSQKSGAFIHPSLNKSGKTQSEMIEKSAGELTKERILQLSDAELTKYMEKVSKIRDNQSSYWSFLPQNFSVPVNYSSNYSRRRRKAQIQCQATQLASNLFSYYKNPNNSKISNSSFSIRNPEYNKIDM